MKKRIQMIAFALVLSILCTAALVQQHKLPFDAIAEDHPAVTATGSDRPVVQFERNSITVPENMSFEVAVLADHWASQFASDLKVHLQISDPQLDIVNTKLTSAHNTLLDMYNQGIIVYAAVNGARYLTAAKERSGQRDFYIRSRAQTTSLCIGGNYLPAITGNRTITLTLREPADGKGYTVGANSTLTITLLDVDTQRPAKPTVAESRADWVRDNLAWLRTKYPDGAHWNHYMGNSNDPDVVTHDACQNGKHRDLGEISGDMALGSSTCNDSSYGVYLHYDSKDSVYVDPAKFSFVQCAGYATTIARNIFGSNPYDGDGWTTYDSASAWRDLEVGDYVRIDGHSFFVIGAKGDVITVTESNVAGDPCVILWDAQYQVSKDGRAVARMVSGGTAPEQRIESVIRMSV